LPRGRYVDCGSGRPPPWQALNRAPTAPYVPLVTKHTIFKYLALPLFHPTISLLILSTYSKQQQLPSEPFKHDILSPSRPLLTLDARSSTTRSSFPACRRNPATADGYFHDAAARLVSTAVSRTHVSPPPGRVGTSRLKLLHCTCRLHQNTASVWVLSKLDLLPSSPLPLPWRYFFYRLSCLSPPTFILQQAHSPQLTQAGQQRFVRREWASPQQQPPARPCKPCSINARLHKTSGRTTTALPRARHPKKPILRYALLPSAAPAPESLSRSLSPQHVPATPRSLATPAPGTERDVANLRSSVLVPTRLQHVFVQAKCLLCVFFPHYSGEACLGMSRSQHC